MYRLSEAFYKADLWVINLVVLASLIIASEVPYWIARRGTHQESKEVIGLKNSLYSSLQTLLSLLIAFTVSMAELRFESRRFTLANETNAISSAYRRTLLTEEPERKQLRYLLRKYVDNRLEFYLAPFDLPQLTSINKKAETIQREIWSIASSVAKKKPNPVLTGPLLDSLNQIIILQEKPTSAFENHVPDNLIFLIIFSSIMMMGYLGYIHGMAGVKYQGRITLAIMISMTLIVILELDRPKIGTIKPGYESLVRLRQGMD